YGDDGLARAVVSYTTSPVILYTGGIFIASLGQLRWRDTLNRLLRMPPIYAAVLAVVVYSFQIPVPAPLLRGIEVAGAGAIPVLLLVLGMQMARARGQFSSRLALPTIALRLLLAPIVAVGIAQLLGLQGLGRATSIVEASMPPAVFTIVLATEFGLQPTAVTGVVVLATLFSPFTIAAAITLLGL
ncbi:MAG: AEC family transporter, partial [Anaerolineales bacterium]|nr:AEC family transporter [Anaerolineales bacterium]